MGKSIRYIGRRVNPRTLRNTHLSLTIAAFITAGIAVTLFGRDSFAVGESSSSSRSLDMVSAETQSRPLLMPKDRRAFARFTEDDLSLDGVSIVGRRRDRVYYRLTNEAGVDCYAVGPATPRGYLFGQIQCAADFPSARRPVLDFTVMHGPPSNAVVWRSEGIVADGVAEIAYKSASDRILGVAQVEGNIYSVGTLADTAIAEIVGRDRDGKEVWAQPVRG